jgi:PAS domain S-box-containing protein
LNQSYTPAVVPEDEAWRLQSLRDLNVLDTAPEAEFDALVKVASLVCGVPISLISLVDADRQWFKADVGLGATQTPRDVAFCAHAILADDVFVVEDALQDVRFAGNPLVQGAPDIRFYAGAPITLANGARVGTLCVIDREPKKLTDLQRQVLKNLGIAASHALEARKMLSVEKSQAVIAARDQAVGQARESQKKLESALQEAAALASTIDIHAIVSEADRHGVITHCNEAFERISGYSRAELIGQNHRIVNSGYHPLSFWVEMWQTISSGAPWRGEICNRAKDGHLYWVDSMIAPFIGNDGLVEKYVSIRTDITHRVLAQRQVEEMSLRMNLAIEGGNDGLWDWPDVKLETQWWSPSYYAMLGYSDSELPPSRNSYLSILHPDFVEASRKKNKEALASGRTFDLVVQLKTKERGYRWFRVRAKAGLDKEGVATRMAGSTQDIHEQKAAEAALLSNKLLLDESQAVAKVGGWELNLQTGVLFWTDETYRIHETSPDKFNPSVDAGVDLFLSDSKRIISEALEAAMSKGVGYDLELQTYTTQGNLIDVRTTCVVTMEGGKAAKLTGIFQDITERKRYERELQAARNEAESAARSKGQFLANMSHEIRTPMNAILGLLNLLQSTELTDRQRDYTSKTEGAAQSLLGLLNDILDFSKVEAGKMTLESEPFRIDKLLRNLSVVLSANVGTKNIEVLFDIDASLPARVRGDAMRLQQVLVNLGGNAVKFTSTGQVVLALRNLAQSGNTVTIEFAVQDTGIGIAVEHQAHIFSGFSQAEGSTTRLFGGTGLGLAISKRFVELMGGDIQINSQPGVGSTFSFALEMPTVDAAAEAVAEPERLALKPQRVLVVDDNSVAGDLTLRMVQSWGWTAELARSGKEAIDRISDRCIKDPSEFPYPVIYMDWKMADMDGWETTRKIRQQARNSGLPQPIVVMITAHGREMLSQRTEDEQETINGFLVKPVTASMLLDAVMDASSGNKGMRKVARGRSSARQLSGMRILVVEDNLINQQVADELLSAEGAIVSLASNGQLGVDAVAAAAPQFDVVLMDVQMPVLDGYGATHAIREDLALVNLPIVAMTANAMASDREACLAAGMNEHIGKPFEMANLVSLLIRMTGFTPDTTLAESQESSRDPELPVPVVKGLDIQTALSRMSGMRSLYLRTARDFVKIMDSIVPELQHCLASGEKKKAMMRLHTLKGNAGTLGATELAEKAGKLEKLCLTGAGMKECEEGLDRLEILVLSTQQKMREAIALLDTPTAPKTSRAAAHGPIAVSSAALESVRHIAALAKASDMGVLQEFAQARELLAELPVAFVDSLDEAFQNLDLDVASERCEVMLSHLAGGT